MGGKVGVEFTKEAMFLFIISIEMKWSNIAEVGTPFFNETALFQ